jgi:hypothetical protein
LRSAVDDRRVADKARVDLEAALRSSEAARGDLAVSLKEARSKSDVVEVGGATGILAMAKRTAEATVDEAVQRAHRLVEDAEVNAAVTQLEAEQRAERARKDMEDEIEALRRQKLDLIAAEVRRLSVQRDVLQADVAALREFLDGERQKLREGVDMLARMLEHDGPVALGRLPVGNAAIMGDSMPELPFRQAGDGEQLASQIPQLIEGPSGDDSGLGIVELDELMESVPESNDESEAGGRFDEHFDGGTAANLGEEREDDEPFPSTVDAGASDRREASPVIDLTESSEPALGSDRSEDDRSDDDDDDAESVGWAAGPSPLGQPRADADAAMRAFFEDGPGDERRGLRWRR